MNLPTPPGSQVPESSKALNEDELTYIFRTTLLPQHREDPNILKFIMEYCRTRDVREASKIVGIHPSSGHALRNRQDIFKCIETIGQKAVYKYGIDPAGVVKKVNEIVDFDPIDILNEDGSFKKLHEMSGEARRAIRKMKVINKFEKDPNGVSIVVGEILDIEFHDKLKASELVGREAGELFKERKVVEHDVTKNMGNILLEAQNRAERAVIDVTPKKDEK